MAEGWSGGPWPSTPLGTVGEFAGRAAAAELAEASHAGGSAAPKVSRARAPSAGSGAAGASVVAAPREGGVRARGPVGRAVGPGGCSALKAGAAFDAGSVSPAAESRAGLADGSGGIAAMAANAARGAAGWELAGGGRIAWLETEFQEMPRVGDDRLRAPMVALVAMAGKAQSSEAGCAGTPRAT